MLFFKLPPVKRPVPLSTSLNTSNSKGSDCLASWAAPLTLRLYGSGTQALAQALVLAKLSHPVSAPQVILPAYACPDLIAACEFAGVYPYLVDTAASAWGYDAKQLERALNANTIAIIAVNLLGVGDQASYLREIADRYGIMLIQDSAQYLPEAVASQWGGDLVVLSFGRGKPLNLMGGGALLLRAKYADLLNKNSTVGTSSIRESILHSTAAALAFNTATHPRVYWLTSSLPGFHVGVTRYVRLKQCRQASPIVRVRLATELCGYLQEKNYAIDRWLPVLKLWASSGVSLLQCAGAQKYDAQYLRLPLLAPNREIRDRLVRVLNNAGLGASAMYISALNRIAGVPEQVAQQGPFPGAESFASRLFTLPTHAAVNERVVARVSEIVMNVANEKL